MRRFLPALLATVRFDAAPAGRCVLDALGAVGRIDKRRRIDAGEVPIDVLTGVWAQLAVHPARHRPSRPRSR